MPVSNPRQSPLREPGREDRPPDPRVRERSVQTERSFTGIVAARVESDLGFRVPGKVVERLVDTGQTVKRGQSLTGVVRDLVQDSTGGKGAASYLHD